MSFIRPDLANAANRLFHRFFTHWVEAFSVVFIGGLGVLILYRGIAEEGYIAVLLGIACLALAILAAVAFRRTALMRRDPTAAGVVEITEGRVLYLTPKSDGGRVDIRELTRIEILTTSDGPFAPDVFWVLTQPGQDPLIIPTEASGTGELFDAFSALPGISWEAVTLAMCSTDDARFLIWEKTVAIS